MSCPKAKPAGLFTQTGIELQLWKRVSSSEREVLKRIGSDLPIDLAMRWNGLLPVYEVPKEFESSYRVES